MNRPKAGLVLHKLVSYKLLTMLEQRGGPPALPIAGVGAKNTLLWQPSCVAHLPFLEDIPELRLRLLANGSGSLGN
jgi:hypothetical protein